MRSSKVLTRALLAPCIGLRSSVKSYHFAASSYAKAFDRGEMPISTGTLNSDFVKKLRVDTIDYIEAHDPASWRGTPSLTPGQGAVATILNGQILGGGKVEETVDAFERQNGELISATPAELEAVASHISSYKPAKTDLRQEVRAMEAEIFDVFGDSPWPHFLVGNQALDFKKQDGVTEVEESVQANLVEQRLNDLLLADEAAGKVEIGRRPAFVGCVSNFSNFLDLCRKTLRNVELGVPCVVLSRSNTTQHMYRWSQMLAQLMPKYSIDPGMVTYIAAPKEAQQALLEANPTSPAYFTCSRAVAKSIRAFHGPAISSTGGPNTLVATRLTPAVSDAIKLSATIENSGQCTALRHAVVQCDEGDVASMLSAVPVLSGPAEALRNGEFAGIFDFSPPAKAVSGYTYHADNGKIAYRYSTNLPPDDIEEEWRNVYVDVTSPTTPELNGSFADGLSRWLVSHQPITLAINAEPGDYSLAQQLFTQTGQVVYTVGNVDSPALTCQARPQDGEVFGEFPVRRELHGHTKYPVVVPTPTPAYNSTYSESYLASRGKGWVPNSLPLEACKVATSLTSDAVRGYVREVADYLTDALAVNPKVSLPGTSRTALFGLQTTPQNGQVGRHDNLGYHACASVCLCCPACPCIHAFTCLCLCVCVPVQLVISSITSAAAAARRSTTSRRTSSRLCSPRPGRSCASPLTRPTRPSPPSSPRPASAAGW